MHVKREAVKSMNPKLWVFNGIELFPNTFLCVFYIGLCSKHHKHLCGSLG